MSFNNYRQPTGRFVFSFSVFSIVALLLGFATEAMGVFDGANEGLKAAWERGGIQFAASAGLNGPTGLLLGVLAIFGLSAAVLGTPGDARRLILGISALALSFALVPVFAVWGIFWKPFGMTLGIVWALGSTFLYARTHRMPCEGVRRNEARNVIPIDNSLPSESRSRRSDG